MITFSWAMLFGVLFVLVTIRFIKNKLKELAFLTAVLGALEVLYFHSTKIGLPVLPESAQIFFIWGALTYAAIRILDIVVAPYIPFVRAIVMFVDGK